MLSETPPQMDGRPLTVEELAPFMEVTGFQGNRILGYIREPLKENVAALKQVFDSAGLTAYFEKTPDGHMITYGHKPARHRSRLWVNGALFLATILTTLLVGALQMRSFLHVGPVDLAASVVDLLRRPAGLLLGLPFSAGIMLVLGSHELAHYLTARRLGVDATLPYFLPVPHPMTGTMGAFIRITSPVPSKGALVRVGLSGPLVGFLVAIPVSLVGLALSRPVQVTTTDGIPLGSSLAFWLMSQLMHPHLAKGWDLSLHPMAFAGWLGLFVTALNLLPVGQLDGGHIAYAVFGRRWSRLSWIVIGALVLLGLFWLGWPFWAVLTTALGLKHPPPLDDLTPLSRLDRVLAVIALVLFVLTFTPAPFGAGRL